MKPEDILLDKTLKAKEKVRILSSHFIDKKRIPLGIMTMYENLNDPNKANCLEAIEYVTKQQPAMMNSKFFQLACNALRENAPRIKSESARIIGNTAHMFMDDVGVAIPSLLDNTVHTGTVVRWSAAFALSKIVLLNTRWQTELIQGITTIVAREEENSIKKIYIEALKELNKWK